MKKRILAFTLLTSMLCTMFAMPVSAYTDAQLEAADLLNELGLFNGYGDDENGNPVYGLDDTVTRTEAVVFLVRLLGKEETAKTYTYTHPFTDVEAWAEGYVRYAYTNRYTTGVSDTLFGSDEQVTANQYLTFVLRALSFTSPLNFEYETAVSYAEEIGLVEVGKYDGEQILTRGDVCEINQSALFTHVRSGGYLISNLGLHIDDKVVTSVLDVNDYSATAWLNAEGGGYAMNLHSLGEGVILDYDELDVLSSVSNSEVIYTLAEALAKIDNNVYVSSGYKVVAISAILVQIIDEGDEGLVVGLSSFMTGSASRSMWMNTLGYRTGDWDMAQAVYGVYYDYYNYVNEGTMPTEILDKYGLTLVSSGPQGNFSGWYIVSNGISTWKMSLSETPSMSVYSCNVTILK